MCVSDPRGRSQSPTPPAGVSLLPGDALTQLQKKDFYLWFCAGRDSVQQRVWSSVWRVPTCPAFWAPSG